MTNKSAHAHTGSSHQHEHHGHEHAGEHSARFLLNGKPVSVHQREISHEALVGLAFPNGKAGSYTVSVRYADGSSLTLQPGGHPAHIHDGMVCSVSAV